MPTEEQIRSDFGMVCNYWGVRLELVIGQLAAVEEKYGIEEPSRMTWGQVNISRKVYNDPNDLALFKIAHEVGHRACPDAPQTEALSILWKTIAAEEGVKYPDLFTNIFCDVMINHYNIVGHMHGVCPWAPVYKSGDRKFYKRSKDNMKVAKVIPRPDVPKCLKFLVELCDITVVQSDQGKNFDLERTVHKLKLSDLHTQVFSLLFFNERDIEYRIRDVAKLTKHLFDQNVKSKPDNREGKENGFTQPIPSPPQSQSRISKEEADDIVKRIMRMYGGNLNDNARKQLNKIPRAISNMRIWKAYQNVIPLIESFRSQREAGGFQGFTRWAVGTPIRQLDVIHSISRYGSLIPGVTTLKQRVEYDESRELTTGHGNICIIVDSSGSMWGAPLDRAVECAVGLVETAKNNKDTFSAIDFSSGMGWHVEPTTAYDDAIEKISRLPSGGTTELYQAAMQALKHAKREGKQCTVVVTDTEIWDIEKCKSVLSLLTKYGKVLVFAIGSRSEHDVYGPTEKVLKNVGAKLYAVPDPKQSFTFDALKELW